MLLATTDYVQGHAFVCFNLMIYKIPMHRKKVRLCYCFYALCCSLSCFSLIIILIDLSIPWDPSKKCVFFCVGSMLEHDAHIYAY
jgi:hypothetical protein